MFKSILILVISALFAGSIYWLTNNDGQLVVNWRDYQIEASLIFILAAFIFYTMVIIGISKFISLIKDVTSSLSSYFFKRKINNRFDDITNFINAIEIEDINTARSIYKNFSQDILDKILSLRLADIENSKDYEKIALELSQNKHTCILGMKHLMFIKTKNGQFRDAIELGEKMLHLNRSLKWLYMKLLHLYKQQKLWYKAEYLIKDALKQGAIEFSQSEQEYVNIYYAHALELFQYQQNDKAAFYLEKALKINPNFIIARRLYVEVLIAAGKPKDALKFLEKGWEIEHDGWSVNKLAWLYRDKSEKERTAIIDKLVSLTKPQYQYRAAQLAIRLGLIDKAQMILNNYASLDKDKEYNQVMLELAINAEAPHNKLKELLNKSII